jgi:hypothetical protein
MANQKFESYRAGMSVASYTGDASAILVTASGIGSEIAVYGYSFQTTGNTTHHCDIVQADTDDITVSSIAFQIAGNNNHSETYYFSRPIKFLENYDLILYPDTGWTGVTNTVNIFYKLAIPNKSQFYGGALLIDPLPTP